MLLYMDSVHKVKAWLQVLMLVLLACAGAVHCERPQREGEGECGHVSG
jgi:hypothetical protein